MVTKTSSYARKKLNELNTENYSSLIEAFEYACTEFAERPAFTVLVKLIVCRCRSIECPV